MATHAEERAAARSRQQSEIEKAVAVALSKAADLLSRQAFGHPPTPDEIHKVLDLIEFVQEARERDEQPHCFAPTTYQSCNP